MRVAGSLRLVGWARLRPFGVFTAKNDDVAHTAPVPFSQDLGATNTKARCQEMGVLRDHRDSQSLCSQGDLLRCTVLNRLVTGGAWIPL